MYLPSGEIAASTALPPSVTLVTEILERRRTCAREESVNSVSRRGHQHHCDAKGHAVPSLFWRAAATSAELPDARLTAATAAVTAAADR